MLKDDKIPVKGFHKSGARTVSKIIRLKWLFLLAARVLGAICESPLNKRHLKVDDEDIRLSSKSILDMLEL